MAIFITASLYRRKSFRTKSKSSSRKPNEHVEFRRPILRRKKSFIILLVYDKKRKQKLDTCKGNKFAQQLTRMFALKQNNINTCKLLSRGVRQLSSS